LALLDGFAAGSGADGCLDQKILVSLFFGAGSSIVGSHYRLLALCLLVFLHRYCCMVKGCCVEMCVEMFGREGNLLNGRKCRDLKI
jgi:hypothetical protein